MRDLTCFQLSTRVIEGDLYLTTLKNTYLGTFFGAAFTDLESLQRCIVQIFDILSKINQLIENFLHLEPGKLMLCFNCKTEFQIIILFSIHSIPRHITYGFHSHFDR